MEERQGTKAVGNAGETAALRYLEETRGCQIVDTNVRFGARSGLVGEIDIVAWDGSTLCFVEVKTHRQRTTRFPRDETPAGWVTPAKQRQIARLALAYVTKHGLGEGNEEIALRFDVVAVTLTGELVTRIEWIPGAFFVPEE